MLKKNNSQYSVSPGVDPHKQLVIAIKSFATTNGTQFKNRISSKLFQLLSMIENLPHDYSISYDMAARNPHDEIIKPSIDKMICQVANKILL